MNLIKSLIKTLLLIFLAFFIGLFVLAFYLFKDKASTFNILSFINQNKPSSVNSTVTKREVIQEESAVIDVINKTKPAVVSIVAQRSNVDPFSGFYSEQSGIGTGFLVKDGFVFTNRHVVDADLTYSVVLNDGKTTFDVVEINKDPLNDYAILKINSNGKDLPYLDLGNSDDLKVGQTVIAIGNALGELDNTASKGIISGIGRTIEAGDMGSGSEVLDNVIQTDAALNPGNSGGPLLDLTGKVIGINVARVINGDNLGFSIPINSIKSVYESFKQFGEIQRPYIGIEYRYLSKDANIYNRLPEGALVMRVIPNSPADKAGVLKGDVITEIEGKKLDAETKLSRIVASKKVGDSLKIKVDREGREIDLDVKLEAAK